MQPLRWLVPLVLIVLELVRKRPLRVLHDKPWASASVTKTVFLIRHGESEWNVAQRNKDPIGMFGTFDHALSAEGAAQAERLRHKIRNATNRSEFDSASVIYCSPLTRAVQTALIALASHPALRRNGPGVTLVPDIRELCVPLGGFDSIRGQTGRAIGSRVVRRAKRVVDHRLLVPLERGVARLDASEAEETWWGLGEGRRQASRRLTAFMRRLCRSKDDVAIVVGHSLFFQAVFANFAAKELRLTDPVIRKLAKSKLPNAAVARVTLNCSNPRYPIVAVSRCFDD